MILAKLKYKDEIYGVIADDNGNIKHCDIKINKLKGKNIFFLPNKLRADIDILVTKKF